MSKKDLETLLVNLEQTVQELEEGELSLDDSIKKFEEGVKIYKDCKTQLSKPRKR